MNNALDCIMVGLRGKLIVIRLGEFDCNFKLNILVEFQ